MPAGLPTYLAESDWLSYGLPFRFQLLSNPLRNDEVIFSYSVKAYADKDFHPVDKLPLWVHDSGNTGLKDVVAEASKMRRFQDYPVYILINEPSILDKQKKYLKCGGQCRLVSRVSSLKA